MTLVSITIKDVFSWIAISKKSPTIVSIGPEMIVTKIVISFLKSHNYNVINNNHDNTKGF